MKSQDQNTTGVRQLSAAKQQNQAIVIVAGKSRFPINVRTGINGFHREGK